MSGGRHDSVRVETGPAPRAAVEALARDVEQADGSPPLSDQTFAELARGADPGPTGHPDIVAWQALGDARQFVGYAQLTDGALEVAAAPEAVDALLDAAAAAADPSGLLIWSHGRRSRLVPVLERRGYQAVRELRQLRAPLTDLPDDPPLAEGIAVRAFEPGRDDTAWLAVNAAAFADHPEQGSWTEDDLRARTQESWFDPRGFLLAERAGELLGFHWTKVHPDGRGEVYVLGISPAAQGLGLGRALLVRGLRHLADERHCREALLYVEGDNAPALHLYERAGFTTYDLDVQWRAAG